MQQGSAVSLGMLPDVRHRCPDDSERSTYPQPGVVKVCESLPTSNVESTDVRDCPWRLRLLMNRQPRRTMLL